MSEPTPAAATDAKAERRRPRLNELLSNVELVVAVLLGVVSIATAYASFESGLYGGQQDQAYTKAQNLTTEAESLYLEGNQQFVQDTQLWNTLSELRIEAASTDPIIAALAQEKYDTLYFQAVSDEFGAAIEKADATNLADPDYYVSPLDDEDYQDALFSSWAETQDEATAALAEGDVYNGYGDRLDLNTVLMAISLFLLGVAAVTRQLKVQYVLIGTGVVIFAVAAVLTAMVPFVWL